MGRAWGGKYFNAELIVEENKLTFQNTAPKLLKYLFNQFPIIFEKGKLEPNSFYLNKFNEYKIEYSLTWKNCEITFKVKKEDKEKLDHIMKSWNF